MDDLERRFLGVVERSLTAESAHTEVEADVTARVEEESRRDLARMVSTRDVAVGLIAAEMFRKSYDEAVGRGGREVTVRLALVTSFVQGIRSCEAAILTGRYVQAAALVRQELETVAALEEALADGRSEGATPNVRALPAGLRREYGTLSRLAHVAALDAHGPLLAEVTDAETRSFNPIPEFRPDPARYL